MTTERERFEACWKNSPEELLPPKEWAWWGWQAALAQPAQPVIPREPTEAMLAAGARMSMEASVCSFPRDVARHIYRAMADAAPQPAQPVAWQPCDRTLRVLARAFRKVAPHLIDEFINRAQEALLQEQDDDNQSNGGRTRGMAGKGDADHAGPAGQRNDEQHDDCAAERGAGLLRSRAHEDCGGGNAARVTEEGAVDAAPQPAPAAERSTDGGDPREVAGPLAEQAGSLTPPERDNGRGPSSPPPSTLSNAECDAIAREALVRCDVPADNEELFVVNLLDIRALIRAGRATVAEDAGYQRRYEELLYAVARKYPGETRHETALRYIREREQAPHGDMGADARAAIIREEG